MKHESAGNTSWDWLLGKLWTKLWQKEVTYQTAPKSKIMMTLGIRVKGTKKHVKPVQQCVKIGEISSYTTINAFRRSTITLVDVDWFSEILSWVWQRLRITEYQRNLLYSCALSNTLHSIPFILGADKWLKTSTFSWLQTKTIYHWCGLCEIHQEVTWLQSKCTPSICGTLRAKKKLSIGTKNHLISVILLLIFQFLKAQIAKWIQNFTYQVWLLRKDREHNFTPLKSKRVILIHCPLILMKNGYGF